MITNAQIDVLMRKLHELQEERVPLASDTTTSLEQVLITIVDALKELDERVSGLEQEMP